MLAAQHRFDQLERVGGIVHHQDGAQLLRNNVHQRRRLDCPARVIRRLPDRTSRNNAERQSAPLGSAGTTERVSALGAVKNTAYSGRMSAVFTKPLLSWSSVESQSGHSWLGLIARHFLAFKINLPIVLYEFFINAHAYQYISMWALP